MDAEFEADFVVARTDLTARRAFLSVYGDGGAKAELVAQIEKPPEWLKRATWLGPWLWRGQVIGTRDTKMS